jgi:DNA helicase-2/ATP-dependent DNA helicase PcrA
MELTGRQCEILTIAGHILVKGGPGSGKTTVAIFKAADVAGKQLAMEQKVLFLSFARASVSRVLQAIQFEQKIPARLQQRIEVDTYHSFFWRILKSHGYLIGLPRSLTIMTPPEAAIALSAIRSEYQRKSTDAEKLEKATREEAERQRLAKVEGRVCFDLFAKYAGEILAGSDRIRALISNRYPLIILDEFQDTNDSQWRVVQQLGRNTTLHALADPEQRIYGWIGADPRRLDHFVSSFAPTCKDLSDDNHRSYGTEIIAFANDVLIGTFRQVRYGGVECKLFEPIEGRAHTMLVTEIYTARKRIFATGRREWSLAILVPTKKMVESVSDVLNTPPAGLSPVRHTASVDMEGPILSAYIVAFLLQPRPSPDHLALFIELLCDFYAGRGGDQVTKTDLQTCLNIRKAFTEMRDRAAAGKPMRANSIIVPTLAVYEAAGTLTLTGDPDKDWLAIRGVLKDGDCPRLKEVVHEVRNVRLLERGTTLRQGLSQDWRDHGAYSNALEIVKSAFLQEHFATSVKPETGVVVMNMHKAKGKQFDEVIIFEGWPRRVKRKVVANPDRIVQSNLDANNTEEARQNLRVAITRAKQKTLILTPEGDPCILLLNRSIRR